MARLIKEKYDNNVEIEYIDADEAERLNTYPGLKDLPNKSGVRLPIVAFDGEPLWSGAVSFPHIIQELNKRGIQPLA